jgi:hypothetical protein
MSTKANQSKREPLEEWWPKYLVRVRQSVEAAEQHLEVPAGTISSIPNDPDFVATVKTYAVIEPILNELITASLRPEYGFGLSPPPQESAALRNLLAGLNMSGASGKLNLDEAIKRAIVEYEITNPEHQRRLVAQRVG